MHEFMMYAMLTQGAQASNLNVCYGKNHIVVSFLSCICRIFLQSAGHFLNVLWCTEHLEVVENVLPALPVAKRKHFPGVSIGV